MNEILSFASVFLSGFGLGLAIANLAWVWMRK